MVSYLFIVDSTVPLSELPKPIQEKPDYIFHTLSDEHITKLILLQKMKMNSNVNVQTPIFLCWHESRELDDLKDKIHPKLYAILQYTADTYGIIHRRIDELTDVDWRLISEQKKYAS